MRAIAINRRQNAGNVWDVLILKMGIHFFRSHHGQIPAFRFYRFTRPCGLQTYMAQVYGWMTVGCC
jgi:hypothetical protein